MSRDLQTILRKVREIYDDSNIEHQEKNVRIDRLRQEIRLDHPDYIEVFDEHVKNAQTEAAQENILKKVRKFGTWGENGQKKIEELRERFTKKFPEDMAKFEETLEKAHQAGSILNDCYYLGLKAMAGPVAQRLCRKYGLKPSKTNPGSLLKKLREELTVLGFEELSKKAGQQFQKGQQVASRHKKEKKRYKNGKPKKTVKPRKGKGGKPTKTAVIPEVRLKGRTLPLPPAGLHPNDIRALQPSPSWTLLIDETGTDFMQTAQARSDRKPQIGRVVGLLLPPEHGLPPLPGWHAVEVDDPAEIDAVMQNILDATCGVIGLTVKSIAPTPGERWAQLIQAVLDWVVRLLPVNGPTRLNVMVEQRGTYKAGQNWQLMADIVQYHLAMSVPERASKIEIAMKTISKKGHECNGYVDAVAFTWAQTTRWSKDRLRDSSFEGTCLLSLDCRTMLDTWNLFNAGSDLSPDIWATLVAAKDADSPSSIVSGLLELLGQECRSNPDLWQRYLNYSKQHVTGKAVNLPKLAREVDWLQRFRPAQQTLPAAMHLVWLTVKLATSNHLGAVQMAELDKIEELSQTLYEEDAPLVCHADLHRAVLATNRYDFSSAPQCLERWGNCDPAVPGLHYWAQVQSSLGQHAAFLGNSREAIKYFETAIEGFRRLSDGGRADCRQTGTYMAIVMMDDAEFNDQQCLDAVASVTGEPSEAVANLARSNSPSEKYAHHLLLRYLVFRGNAELEKKYLDLQNEWKSGTGHPWPLIIGYRAILIYPVDKEKAVDFANQGAALAFMSGQGPVVNLIGSCLRAISHVWGDTWENADAVLDRLVDTLPMASERIETIRHFMEHPVDAREIFINVLPFNFR